jgi:DNA-binding NtrC family response regulator
MPTAQLTGLHVLVVEDDPMIGLLVEDLLIDAGCHVSGPYISFGPALQAAETEAVDVAVLDVNLAGILAYPIGEALQARGIPFVLTSGYGDRAAPAEHKDWLTCSKPFTPEALTSALASALARRHET